MRRDTVPAPHRGRLIPGDPATTRRTASIVMGHEFVTVKIYRTAMEAHVDRLVLEGHELHVFIENENYDEGPAWPTDGVRLTVPRDQAERALEILDGGSHGDAP